MPGTVVSVKFRIPLPLAPGDMFFDIGVDEMTGHSSNFRNLCRKISCIKLSVYSEKNVYGIVDFAANFKVVSFNEQMIP